MENKDKMDDFLKKMGDRFKDLEVNASADVWKEIEKELDASDKNGVKRLNLEEKRRIFDFLKYGSAS